MNTGRFIRESPLGFQRGLVVLAVGAHPDDIELGCAATIMMLLDHYEAKVFYRLLTYGGASTSLPQNPTFEDMRKIKPRDRAVEAFKAAARMGLPLSGDDKWKEAFEAYSRSNTDKNIGTTFDVFMKSEELVRQLREKKLGIKKRAPYDFPSIPAFKLFSYPDTQLPNHWHEILDDLEQFKKKLRQEMNQPDGKNEILPQLVLHHTLNDFHQDHHTIALSSLRAFRQGEVRLSYSILQFEPRGFTPNFYTNVSGKTIWGRQVMDKAGDELDAVNPNYGKIICKHKLDNATIYFKTGSYAQRKADLIRECYRTQYMRGRFYTAPDRVLGLMRNNAIHVSYKTSFAEAFEGRLAI